MMPNKQTLKESLITSIKNLYETAKNSSEGVTDVTCLALITKIKKLNETAIICEFAMEQYLNTAIEKETASKQEIIDELTINDSQLMKTINQDIKDLDLEDKYNESLNQQIQSSNDISIAEKIQSQPITSLSAAIELNDKFVFINELFKGNTELYQESIKTIDDCTSIGEAISYVSNFQWDASNDNVKHFIAFIERRFL